MFIIITLFHTNTQSMFEIHKIMQFNSSGGLILSYFISLSEVVEQKYVFYTLELSHYIFCLPLAIEKERYNTTNKNSTLSK